MIHVCVNVVQSYGGFLASHAVANDTDVFPCGVSGAALSDRRYYGTVVCLLPTHKHNPLLYSAAHTHTHTLRNIHRSSMTFSQLHQPVSGSSYVRNLVTKLMTF